MSTGREDGEAAAEEWNAVLRPWGREALVSLLPVAWWMKGPAKG